MRVAVYYVAVGSGGGLTVLKDYYRRALQDKDNDYLFIVGLANLPSSDNVTVYKAPRVKRSWMHRLFFDLKHAHRIINEFGAERIVSLQNIRVPFINDIEQIVYMHNLLPRQICDLRFSFIKDPKLWTYQNVIGQLIVYSMRKADGVIVQAEWIKRRIVDECGVCESKIVVEKPRSEFEAIDRKPSSDANVFFYPASSASYKNHDVVIKACSRLHNMGLSNFKVIFTLSRGENERVVELMKEAEGLPIEFCGWLDSYEMQEMYRTINCLLFPSRLETLGLPLREAAANGINVISADLEYARESLSDYPRAQFCDPLDDEAWAMEMRKLICA